MLYEELSMILMRKVSDSNIRELFRIIKETDLPNLEMAIGRYVGEDGSETHLFVLEEYINYEGELAVKREVLECYIREVIQHCILYFFGNGAWEYLFDVGDESKGSTGTYEEYKKTPIFKLFESLEMGVIFENAMMILSKMGDHIISFSDKKIEEENNGELEKLN